MNDLNSPIALHNYNRNTIIFKSGIMFCFLAGKKEIMDFLNGNKLESIAELTLDEQYWKIRTKLFNERKTVRDKRKAIIREITKPK